MNWVQSSQYKSELFSVDIRNSASRSWKADDKYYELQFLISQLWCINGRVTGSMNATYYSKHQTAANVKSINVHLVFHNTVLRTSFNKLSAIWGKKKTVFGKICKVQGISENNLRGTRNTNYFIANSCRDEEISITWLLPFPQFALLGHGLLYSLTQWKYLRVTSHKESWLHTSLSSILH